MAHLNKTDFNRNNKYLKALKEQRENIDDFIKYHPIILNETLSFIKKLKMIEIKEYSELSLDEEVNNSFFNRSFNWGYRHDVLIPTKTEGHTHHCMKYFITKKLLERGYNVFFEFSLNIKSKTYTNLEEILTQLKLHLEQKTDMYNKNYHERNILHRLIRKTLRNIERFDKKLKGDTYRSCDSVRKIVDVFGISILESGKYIIAECDNKNINDKWMDYYECLKSYNTEGTIKFIQVSTKKVNCPSFVENIIMGDFQSQI